MFVIKCTTPQSINILNQLLFNINLICSVSFLLYMSVKKISNITPTLIYASEVNHSIISGTQYACYDWRHLVYIFRVFYYSVMKPKFTYNACSRFTKCIEVV